MKSEPPCEALGLPAARAALPRSLALALLGEMRLRTLLCGVLLLATAIPLPGLVAAVCVSAHTELDQQPSRSREYRAITRHLRSPFRGYGTLDVLAPQFGIVALSHIASGLLNVLAAEPDKRAEVQESLGEVVKASPSASISPFDSPTDVTTPLEDHNLFWSHLGVILGIERYVRCGSTACPSETDVDRLQERIVQHLHARTMETGLFHAPSYPDSPMWPADQTVSCLR